MKCFCLSFVPIIALVEKEKAVSSSFYPSVHSLSAIFITSIVYELIFHPDLQILPILTSDSILPAFLITWLTTQLFLHRCEIIARIEQCLKNPVPPLEEQDLVAKVVSSHFQIFFNSKKWISASLLHLFSHILIQSYAHSCSFANSNQIIVALSSFIPFFSVVRDLHCNSWLQSSVLQTSLDLSCSVSLLSSFPVADTIIMLFIPGKGSRDQFSKHFATSWSSFEEVHSAENETVSRLVFIALSFSSDISRHLSQWSWWMLKVK